MKDMVVKTVKFGFDIDETEFDAEIIIWSDGGTTTLASIDQVNYEPVLVTTAGPTTIEIEEAIIKTFCT